MAILSTTFEYFVNILETAGDREILTVFYPKGSRRVFYVKFKNGVHHRFLRKPIDYRMLIIQEL